MFLKLDDAKKIDASITQDDIDALEVAVRQLTNNHFHVEVTKRHFIAQAGGSSSLSLYFKDSSIVLPTLNGKPTQATTDFIKYFHKGDTIEVYGTGYNDGVFEIVDILPKKPTDGTASDSETDLDYSYNITVRMPAGIEEFIEGSVDGSLVKVYYPLDVIAGVKKLLQYDINTASLVGIKSETVSRLSTTYFDMTASESEGGYPRSLITFMYKYRRLDWN